MTDRIMNFLESLSFDNQCNDKDYQRMSTDVNGSPGSKGPDGSNGQNGAEGLVGPVGEPFTYQSTKKDGKSIENVEQDEQSKQNFIFDINEMIVKMEKPDDFVVNAFYRFEREIGIESDIFDMIKLGLEQMFEMNDDRLNSYKILFMSGNIGLSIFLKVVEKSYKETNDILEVQKNKIKSLLQLINAKRSECSRLISEKKTKQFISLSSKILTDIAEEKRKMDEYKEKVTQFVASISKEITTIQTILKSNLVGHIADDLCENQNKKSKVRSKYELLNATLYDFIHAVLDRQIEIEFEKCENKGRKLAEFFTSEKIESIRDNIQKTLKSSIDERFPIAITNIGLTSEKSSLNLLLE